VYTDPDIHSLQAYFNNIARSLFEEAYNTFRSDVAGISRSGNENVYQLLRSKHCYKFKQLLDHHANLLIGQCDRAEMQIRLRMNLAERIHYFEAELIRKTNEY